MYYIIYYILYINILYTYIYGQIIIIQSLQFTQIYLLDLLI